MIHERVALSLGSNLGDRRALLERAIELIRERGLLEDVRVSAVHETAAVGPPQPDFLNLVVVGRTRLDPEQLLAATQRIECELGRPRDHEHWGPRLIDIDVLVHGETRSESPELRLPHPELARRGFVLEPWSELEPERWLPELHATVAELAARIRETVRSDSRRSDECASSTN